MEASVWKAVWGEGSNPGRTSCSICYNCVDAKVVNNSAINRLLFTTWGMKNNLFLEMLSPNTFTRSSQKRKKMGVEISEDADKNKSKSFTIDF